MQEYFKKIDLRFENLENAKGNFLFGYGAIFYSDIKSKKLLEEIECKFAIKPTKCFYVEIFNYLGPHFDRGADSCINYYIESGNYVTNFWEISNKNYTALETIRYEANTTQQSKIKSKFKKEDLTLKSSFIAENESCYILNISKIHSLDKNEISLINNHSKRSLLQFQWDCDYSHLINIINEKNV